MWDHTPDGHYIAPDSKRLEYQKKLSSLTNDELLVFVRAYENWLSDQRVNDLSQAFLGFFSMAYCDNNPKQLAIYLEEYDAICREIARRWVGKNL